MSTRRTGGTPMFPLACDSAYLPHKHLSVINPMPKRLFVAIDLPESTRQLLAALDPHVRGVRWTDPAQMHLPLSFYGNVLDAGDLGLQERLNAMKFGAFLLAVVGVGD